MTRNAKARFGCLAEVERARFRGNWSETKGFQMDYVVTGLSPQPFQHLYGLSDGELAQHGAKRYVADVRPGYPDRIEMREAEIGQTLLLVNHVSMDKATPYRASHAIFIREGAVEAGRFENEIPQVMRTRLLSLRAFDAEGWMVDAYLAAGDDVVATIKRFFEDPEVAFLHAHNAARGCYAGEITRR